MKNVKLGFGTFFGIVLIGYLALVFVYCLPAERICAHVRESSSMFGGNNLYKELSKGDVTTRQDYFTDILMMMTAAYEGPENPLVRAANNYRVMKQEASFVESCSLCGQIPENEREITEYSRYWHGYVVLLRPLLLLFNINEFRSINLFMVLGGIITIFVLLYKQKKTVYMLPLLLAYSYINPMAVSVSIQYSAIFYITAAAVAVLLYFQSNPGFQEKMWLYFMVIGMSTSYFDLFTYPLVTLGFPLILSFAFDENVKIKDGIKKVIGFSSMWGIGYMGMWCSKWILASVITHRDHFAVAFDAVRSRVGNHISVGGEARDVTLFQVYARELSRVANNSLKYLLLLFFVFIIFCLFCNGIKKANAVSCAMILIVGLYPFIWYLATRNHSYIHPFTYRELSVSVLAVTACPIPLLGSSRRFRRKRKISG